MEQGPGPSTLNTYPPPYLPGNWGSSLLVALNKNRPGQWSGHLRAAQPRTCSPRKMYVLYFLSSNTAFWNAYQMIVCVVLIVVIYLVLINHYMELTNSPRAFITLSWVSLSQVQLVIIATQYELSMLFNSKTSLDQPYSI